MTSTCNCDDDSVTVFKLNKAGAVIGANESTRLRFLFESTTTAVDFPQTSTSISAGGAGGG